MLTKLEQTKQALAGKHKAIDDWLDARQALLVGYMQLAGLTPARTKQRSLPKTEELHHFCDRLVDYVSAGHFEIYHHVVTAFEQASGENTGAGQAHLSTYSYQHRIRPRVQRQIQ